MEYLAAVPVVAYWRNASAPSLPHLSGYRMDLYRLTMHFASLPRLTSARSAFAYISRLTATATFAYLVALVIPAGTNRPVLAPLTALLVLQASLFQTVRSAIRKVLSVTVGVLVAVAV